MQYHSITQDEIDFIIDAIINGKIQKNNNSSDLERTLILINQKIIQQEAIEKPQFPEEWGISRDVIAFETALGLPPTKYFSRPRLEKSYF